MATSAAGASTPIVELDEIDSTNAEALRRASRGERGPLWIMAHRQTAGRGRSGRSWQTPAGNLAATLLFVPGCAPAEMHQLSLLVGVAVHDALAPHHAGANLRLKWPNDILAGEAKLGGILIESTTAAAITVAAIGIGINVATAPALTDRPTAALAQFAATQPPPTPRALLDAIDAAMSHWLSVWQAGAGFAAIRVAWLERAVPLGQPIAVDTVTSAGASRTYGAFGGIDETGALLVGNVEGNPGETRRFTFGDVSLVARQTEG